MFEKLKTPEDLAAFLRAARSMDENKDKILSNQEMNRFVDSKGNTAGSATDIADVIRIFENPDAALNHLDKELCVEVSRKYDPNNLEGLSNQYGAISLMQAPYRKLVALAKELKENQSNYFWDSGRIPKDTHADVSKMFQGEVQECTVDEIQILNFAKRLFKAGSGRDA